MRKSLLNNLITSLAAFNGMEMENMTRGYGWRFLDMGRRRNAASKPFVSCERRCRKLDPINRLPFSKHCWRLLIVQ